jgi:hypothetical protein
VYRKRAVLASNQHSNPISFGNIAKGAKSTGKEGWYRK